MAKKSATEKTARTIVRVKSPRDWDDLIKRAQEQAWRKLQVEIFIRSKLLAGKPASLDAAKAMLAARGLDEFIEAVSDIEDPAVRAQAAERVATDEGLCEFVRRPGYGGIWIPSNNVKAGIKENWQVLGLRKEVAGSTKALAEGLFVFGCDGTTTEDRDWILVGDAPAGVDTSVSHSIGPRGPVSSIKRHEFVEHAVLRFEVWYAHVPSVSQKISDDDLARCLVHFGEHGLGACRSQGHGKFDVVKVCELQGEADDASAAA